MPYSVTQRGAMMKIVFSGTLTNDDLSRGADEVAEIERSCAVIPHRSADLRPVERLEIDFGGVLELAMKRRQLAFQNSFKSAVIAASTVHYGFARMYQTLNDHPQLCLAIFPDEDQAMEWLNQAGTNPPAEPWQPERSWILL